MRSLADDNLFGGLKVIICMYADHDAIMINIFIKPTLEFSIRAILILFKKADANYTATLMLYIRLAWMECEPLISMFVHLNFF